MKTDKALKKMTGLITDDLISKYEKDSGRESIRAEIEKIGADVTSNHEEALKLWHVATVPARILSMLIDQPQKIFESQMREQLQEIDSALLADLYSDWIISRTYYDLKMAVQMHKNDNEYYRRISYRLFGGVAISNQYLEDSFFLEICDSIQKAFDSEPDSVKDAITFFLSCLEQRNPALKERVEKFYK